MEITIPIEEYRRLKRLEGNVYYFIRIVLLFVLLMGVWAVLTIIAADKPSHLQSVVIRQKGRMYHRGGTYGRKNNG